MSLATSPVRLRSAFRKLTKVSRLNERILAEMDHFEHIFIELLEHEWTTLAKQMPSRSHILWIEQYFYPVHIQFWRKPLLPRLVHSDGWTEYVNCTRRVFTELQEQQLNCDTLIQLVALYQRIFLHVQQLAMQNLLAE